MRGSCYDAAAQQASRAGDLIIWNWSNATGRAMNFDANRREQMEAHLHYDSARIENAGVGTNAVTAVE